MLKEEKPLIVKEKKPLIGVLASHDSLDKNRELAQLFADLYQKDAGLLGQFHFVFTGGTFDRVVLGKPGVANACPIPDVNARDFVRKNSTRLPNFAEGGVTILANLVVQRQCHHVWPFLSPVTTHWLNPENFALMRLIDIWKNKRSMTSGSVKNWFQHQAPDDARRNLQDIPLTLRADYEPNFPLATARKTMDDYYLVELPPGPTLEKTIALIAHDEMKPYMVDFAIEFEDELANKFQRILTTGATGQEILSATRKLKNLIRLCRPGPKGGDIEIATEILFRRVHVIVFFVDPLHPHPHIEDVRTVFSACMRRPEVLLLTNEVQAREWIRRN